MKGTYVLDVRSNTVQENTTILYQIRCNQQVNVKSKDLTKLFAKLNRKNASRVNAQIDYTGPLSQDKNVTHSLYGPIPGFPPGSWWGIRMDCARDRVHDPFNVDIQIGLNGATSICTSDTNMKQDVDLGDFLTLTGQVYFQEMPDKDILIQNFKNQIPLRLIRSYNLLNEFAPRTGYRYDGLYLVAAHWIGLDSNATKYHKFAFMRCANQESAPWHDKPTFTRNNESQIQTDISKCSSCCTYELRKRSCLIDNTDKSTEVNNEYSIGNRRRANIAAEKVVPDSTIVTRRVFKKRHASVECTPVEKQVSQCYKALSSATPDVPATRNTNISIRMDLYDSSHNVQQDIKKNNSASFHKKFKPSSRSKQKILYQKTARQISSAISQRKKTGALVPTHIRGTLEFGLYKNSNVSNKKNHTSPQDRHKNYFDSKLSNIDTTSAKTVQELNTGHGIESEHDDNEISSDVNIEHKQTLKHKSYCSAEKPNSHIQPVTSCKNARFEEKEKYSLTTQEFKTLQKINSLTPDKILNVINEEKFHPLSKMLIDNVIGSIPCESIMSINGEFLVQTESAFDHSGNNNKKQNSPMQKNDPVSEASIKVKSHTYRQHKKYSLLPLSLSKHYDFRCKVMNDNVASKNSVQNFNAKIPNLSSLKSTIQVGESESIQVDLSEQKDHYRNKVNKNIRIQVKDQPSDVPYHESKNKQEDITDTKKAQFAINTVKNIDVLRQLAKPVTKRNPHRKQRRELANLSIDAKIGPKIRGPRNRRLRYGNNVYTRKQCYDCINNIISKTIDKKPSRSIQKCKTSFKANKSAKPEKSKSPLMVSEKRDNETIFKAKPTSTRSITHMPMEQHKNSFKLNQSIVNNLCNITKKYNNTNKDTNKNSIDTKISSNIKVKVIHSLTKKFQAPKLINNTKPKRSKSQTNCTKIHNNVLEHSKHSYDKEQITKPCTSDATIQCSLLSETNDDPLPKITMDETRNGTCVHHQYEQQSVVKVEYCDLKSVKCETPIDVMSDGDSSIVHQTKSPCCTYRSLNSNDYTYVQSEQENDMQYYIKHSDLQCSTYTLNNKESKMNSEQNISAFVPVNTYDNDSRVARLRSIGFKPIISYYSHNTNEHLSRIGTELRVEEIKSNVGKVTRRDVAEEYNKYTSGENDTVVYMDEELQYQDIEDEDVLIFTPNATRNEIVLKKKILHKERLESFSKDTGTNLLLEQDLELPWHGWKEIVTNKESYWIGW